MARFGCNSGGIVAAIELINTSLFLDPNLVSYYRLENVNDSKGSNTLTNNGTVTFTSGLFNNCANLGTPNSTKYLSRADNLGIAGNGDMSISIWIKLLGEIGSGTYYLIAHTSTTTADRFSLLYYEYNGGTMRLVLNMSGTTGVYNITLGTTDWYNLIVTRNVSGNAGKLYINAVERISTTLGSTGNATNDFTLGATNSPANFASTLYDDVSVFNRVLTPTEIIPYYNGTLQKSNFLPFL